jgi:hypothetical protein
VEAEEVLPNQNQQAVIMEINQHMEIAVALIKVELEVAVAQVVLQAVPQRVRVKLG